ncbi:MAG: class I SAM-dependent methyltransferase [Fimbriimonadaceae bacterium]|nr:class I SAM-dependent methyltransferase [Chitinophagales bacterium]
MKKLLIVWKYLLYKISAKTKYDVHSPFVYNFIADVLEDKKPFYAFEEIEMLRIYLKHSDHVIHVEDFGAGSHTMQNPERKISDIARSNLISKKFGELLFRIINYYNPIKILEFGTSFGISTLYLAKANSNAKVVTLEGSETIAEIATKNFKKTGCSNIHLFAGEFSHTLPNAINTLKQLDFIFIDGNHRKKPTLKYFTNCLPYCTDNSIFVFDDIHWSSEMEAAWKEIQQHPSVTLSIDLFFKGIIFMRKDFHHKQHFTLRFS